VRVARCSGQEGRQRRLKVSAQHQASGGGKEGGEARLVEGLARGKGGRGRASSGGAGCRSTTTGSSGSAAAAGAVRRRLRLRRSANAKLLAQRLQLALQACSAGLRGRGLGGQLRSARRVCRAQRLQLCLYARCGRVRCGGVRGALRLLQGLGAAQCLQLPALRLLRRSVLLLCAAQRGQLYLQARRSGLRGGSVRGALRLAQGLGAAQRIQLPALRLLRRSVDRLGTAQRSQLCALHLLLRSMRNLAGAQGSELGLQRSSALGLCSLQRCDLCREGRNGVGSDLGLRAAHGGGKLSAEG